MPLQFRAVVAKAMKALEAELCKNVPDLEELEALLMALKRNHNKVDVCNYKVHKALMEVCLIIYPLVQTLAIYIEFRCNFVLGCLSDLACAFSPMHIAILSLNV